MFPAVSENKALLSVTVAQKALSDFSNHAALKLHEIKWKIHCAGLKALFIITLHNLTETFTTRGSILPAGVLRRFLMHADGFLEMFCLLQGRH